MTFKILHSAKSYPKHKYQDIKNTVLGEEYMLNLIFIGTTRARSLNMVYRNATYIPNVLSFPLEKNTGEIYITPIVAKKESKKFTMSPNTYIGYLFVHALLHLKGYPHGATMEQVEKRLMKKFFNHAL